VQRFEKMMYPNNSMSRRMPQNEGSPHSTPFFVNIASLFFRPFFSVKKMTSQEQLLEDFGEFPPTPLRCENLTGDFNVVRTSGIGQIYHDLAIQFRVLDTDIDSLSTDLISKFGADKLHDVRSTLEHLGPSISRFLFCWLLVVRTAAAIRYGAPRSNALGLFVPLFKDELQIVVKAQRNLHNSDAHIVSHEHIHVLQHRNPESHCRHVRSPQELLSEDGCADSLILYILEKKEIEARLHESVLSFYRKHHYLPMTVSSFLGLLASSETIGSLVTSILESGAMTPHRGEETYSERAARPVEHLKWVLIEIKTPDLQRRYITEVLTVMYGNLLKYYGDGMASRSFLSGIERPNFYDDLYSVRDA
jgi:hypothetical protein